jgi:hypothetical protein
LGTCIFNGSCTMIGCFNRHGNPVLDVGDVFSLVSLVFTISSFTRIIELNTEG